MSLSFLLAGAPLPDPPALVAMLPVGASLQRQGGRRAGIGMVVVEGRSTRGTLLSWDADTGLGLEVPSLASEEDLAVAVELAARLAERFGLPIQAQGRSSGADRLRALWTEGRRAWQIRQDERTLRGMAEESRVRIDGVNRPVFLGPRVLARLRDEPGALVDWLREVQWLPGHEPLALVPERFGGDPMGSTVVTLEPGVRQLVRPCELVVVPGEPALYVPRASAADVLGDLARLLDEEQLLVEAISPDEMVRLRTRARQVAIAEPASWRRTAGGPRGVLPVLRSPTAMVEDAVSWSLCAERGEGLPVVSLVEERGRTRTPVGWADLGAESLASVQERAIRELEHRLPRFDLERDISGRVAALELSDAFAAEALLSRSRLEQAHRLLDAGVLVAAIPVRGTLRIERAEASHLDDPADPARLLAWSRALWEGASLGGAATPLTPHLLLIIDGEVRGIARDGGPALPAEDEGSIDMPGLAEQAAAVHEADPRKTFDGSDRAILALAVPALGSLAVEPLVSLVDTAFVSSLGDASVGGLGVAGALLSLAFVVFNFLAYGTTPLVAEARARGAREEGGRLIVAALTVALLIGVVGGVLLYALAPVLVLAMGASDSVYEPALTYLTIRILGAPALLLIIAGHGAYRGFQDTTTPLLLSVAVAAVNVALDALFLLGWGWDIAGAAWAAVIAQWVGALGFLALLFGPAGHRRGVPRALPRMDDLRRLVSVGSILSVRTLAVVATMALATSIATRLGEASIAAHQIVHQLWMAAALLADGLAVAAQTLLASAPTPAASRAVVRRLLIWGFFTGLFLAGLLLMSQLVLPVAFRLSDEALLLASQAAVIAALVQPVAALVFVGDGLYLGARRFGFAAGSMVASAVLGAVGLVVLPTLLGLNGVWVALGMFTLVRAGLLALGAVFPGRDPLDERQSGQA